jgi:hypothetical protein
MALNSENVKIGEVAGELSLERINYLSGLELLDGKFVRLEGLIVVGPTGIRVANGSFTDWLTHHNLMEYGLDDMGEEVVRRIESAKPSSSYLHKAGHLVDAGHYRIGADAGGQLNQLVLDGESIDYGRPDNLVRQATVELARLALGQDFRVIIE